MEGFQSMKPYPTYKDVYKHLSQEDIFSMYLGKPFSLGVTNSVIGASDNHASLSIFYSRRFNKIKFKEHRYGYSGDAIDFVRIVCNYHSQTEACMRILHDFGIDGYHIASKISSQSAPGISITGQKKVNLKRIDIDIQIQSREWEPHDLEYWNQYGITMEWLKKGHVYPLKYYFINGNTRYAEKYSYAYLEMKDGKPTFKIYQPFAKKQTKWINNNNASVWELWHLLPKSFPYLIISKSRKDALSIMATMGIPSTAFQSEGTLPKKHVMENVKSRFKNIWVLYDNDFDKDTNYGLEYSNRLVEKFDLDQIIIPSIYEEKDYTDLIARKGIVFGKNVLKSLIQQKLKEK